MPGHEEAEDTVQQCHICGQEVDARIDLFARLSCRSCGKYLYHQDCYDKYLKRQHVAGGRETAGTRTGLIYCPRGRCEVQGPPCKGRVESVVRCAPRSEAKKAKNIANAVAVAEMLKMQKAAPKPPLPPAAPKQKKPAELPTATPAQRPDVAARRAQLLEALRPEPAPVKAAAPAPLRDIPGLDYASPPRRAGKGRKAAAAAAPPTVVQTPVQAEQKKGGQTANRAEDLVEPPAALFVTGLDRYNQLLGIRASTFPTPPQEGGGGLDMSKPIEPLEENEEGESDGFQNNGTAYTGRFANLDGFKRRQPTTVINTTPIRSAAVAPTTTAVIGPSSPQPSPTGADMHNFAPSAKDWWKPALLDLPAPPETANSDQSPSGVSWALLAQQYGISEEEMREQYKAMEQYQADAAARELAARQAVDAAEAALYERNLAAEELHQAKLAARREAQQQQLRQVQEKVQAQAAAHARQVLQQQQQEAAVAAVQEQQRLQTLADQQRQQQQASVEAARLRHQQEQHQKLALEAAAAKEAAVARAAMELAQQQAAAAAAYLLQQQQQVAEQKARFAAEQNALFEQQRQAMIALKLAQAQAAGKYAIAHTEMPVPPVSLAMQPITQPPPLPAAVKASWQALPIAARPESTAVPSAAHAIAMPSMPDPAPMQPSTVAHAIIPPFTAKFAPMQVLGGKGARQVNMYAEVEDASEDGSDDDAEQLAQLMRLFA